jgi:hypothetical protein
MVILETAHILRKILPQHVINFKCISWRLLCIKPQEQSLTFAHGHSGTYCKTAAATTATAYYIPCETCRGQSGTQTGFSELFSFRLYHSTVGLQIHIIWGTNNRPIGGCNSETWSHPVNMNMPYLVA